ncbi:hypothetical protein ACGFIF_07020 [Kribbella sp. NPDC049174]|uniref:hypothetical protein n=1 Tax=Kribbella sp. NPDC049174 TaxID=3364112 RepID=UPI0037169951
MAAVGSNVDRDGNNSAVCVTGDGVLGHHRKVHQALREDEHYAAGDLVRGVRYAAGLMICYDKAFPKGGADARPRRRSDHRWRGGALGLTPGG